MTVPVPVHFSEYFHINNGVLKIGVSVRKWPIINIMILQIHTQETAFCLGTIVNLLLRRVGVTGHTIIIQLVLGQSTSY